MNDCSCLPLCDTVDYAVAKSGKSGNDGAKHQLTIRTAVNKWRLKRDILLSVDFVFGSTNFKTFWILSIYKS